MKHILSEPQKCGFQLGGDELGGDLLQFVVDFCMILGGILEPQGGHFGSRFASLSQLILMCGALPPTHKGRYIGFGIGYWILDSGYWILDILYWIFDIGYWIFDIEYSF